MLEIHSKDYFSLSYDAAASNRISSINGKNYVRGLEEQTKRIPVKHVRLMGDDTEVSLPLKVMAASSLNGNVYELNGWKVMPVNGLRNDSQLQTYYFTHGLGSDFNDMDTTHQFTVLATFEVIFSGLNLPVGVVPKADLTFELQHKKHVSSYSGDVTSGTDRNISSEGFSLVRALFGGSAYDAFDMQEGAFLNHDWTRIWVGAGLKPTDLRDQAGGSDGKGDISTTHRWSIAYSYKNDNYIFTEYSRTKGKSDYTTSGEEIQGFDESNFEIVIADSTKPLRGNSFNLVTLETQLVDRDTCIVRGVIPILNACVSSEYWRSGVDTDISETIISFHEWLKSFEVLLTYEQMTWTGTDFTVTDSSEQDLYPYKFQSSRIANARDTVLGRNWMEVYPKILLGKYGKGKHYIELKVRVDFMLKNNVSVDTLLQIYDLKNKPIMRGGIPCTFRVKRIVKSFSSNEFYYTINCLEE